MDTTANPSTAMADPRDTKARLAATMSRIAAGEDDMKRWGAVTDACLARIANSLYARDIVNITPRVVRNELNFIAPAITHRAWEIDPFMANALLSPRITTRQAADLCRSDLVISGRTPDNRPIHVLAEVSITIHDDDIRRAHRRAQILHATLDDHAPVIPAAFGDNLDAGVAAAARAMGVHILIIPAEDGEVIPAPAP